MRGLPPRSQQESFSTRAPPVLAFDGLDDLEEEEDPEESLASVPKERALVPRKPLGEGLVLLENLYEKYREDDEEPPELSEEELEELHESLKQDIPRCPAVSSVAWTAKVLEEMELEDDDVFEVIADMIKERVDELEPQETLDVVLSFGGVYFIDEDLLSALVGAVRRQMKYFTNMEVVKLANAMCRLGGTDDTKHLGMFFEMRKRVNLPLIDKFIKDRLGREASYYDTDEGLKKLTGMFKLPEKSKLKEKFDKKMHKELAYMQQKMLAEASRQEELEQPEWLEGTDGKAFLSGVDSPEAWPKK